MRHELCVRRTCVKNSTQLLAYYVHVTLKLDTTKQLKQPRALVSTVCICKHRGIVRLTQEAREVKAKFERSSAEWKMNNCEF